MIGAYCSYNAYIVFLCLREVMFANFLLLYLDSWQSYFFFLNNTGKSSKGVTDKRWHTFWPNIRFFRAWEVVEWSCNKRKGGWVMWIDRKKKRRIWNGRRYDRWAHKLQTSEIISGYPSLRRSHSSYINSFLYFLVNSQFQYHNDTIFQFSYVLFLLVAWNASMYCWS